MPKLVVSEWISLDGVFDAEPQYFENWFLPYHSDDRAAYIKNTVEASGALVLGRTTYEMLAPYWSSQDNDEMGPASALNSMPKYVVSSTMEEAEWSNTRKIIKKNVAEEIAAIKDQAGGDVLITGSATLAASLIGAAIIDEYRLLVHPVIMGRGRRFFAEHRSEAKLELVDIQRLSLGVLALHYQAAE